MKTNSIWCNDIKIKNVKKLDEDITTDILIIGGGITGITTAYYLKDSEYNITLIEQNFIGMGVTSKTTAKINYLQETIYTDLKNTYNFNIAKKYLESQLLAIKEINRIVKKENINCNLEQAESFVFTNNKNEIKKLKKEKDILESLGVKVNEYEKSSQFKYAISVNDTYVFHPLKYLYNLKKIIEESNINIYEKTRVQKMEKTKDGYLCYTENNKIKAHKVILACHYPYFLKPFLMPLKVYTEKSYITASEVKNYQNKTYITSKLPCKSIRFYKDQLNYLIYLSNSHNIANNKTEKNSFSCLIKELNKLKINPEYLWSNDDMMTLDKLPYIGYIEKNNTNLLIGTGYNTWGMTNGTLAGLIIKDLICHNSNKYASLFNPLRTNSLFYTPSYLYNLSSSIKSYVGHKITKKDSPNIKYINENGNKLAIYDDGSTKHIVKRTCPHMGCNLIFNEVEKTWDCPCHASRFDIDGKCIKGPSCYDISYKR